MNIMEDDLIEYVRFDNDQDFLEESRSSTWTKSQTLKLIDAYDQYKESFTHVKQRKHAWDLISTHLQAIDVMKSTKECSVKWSNLLRTYKTVKDNKKKTGRKPIRFDFFEEIDAIIGHKSSNAEQGVGVNVGASTSQCDILTSEPQVTEPTEMELGPKPKKRRLTMKEQYYKAKLEWLAKKDEREEQLIEIEKEKLEILKKLLNK